jgi:hypothetical protein
MNNVSSMMRKLIFCATQTFSNDVSRVESNVVSNEMFRVVSISLIQSSFIRISAHKTKNVFSKNIIRIVFKMLNAHASKTIRLIEFVLWFENILRNIFRDERCKIVKKSDFYQTKNQHELNIFLRKYMQIFEIRSVINRMSLDRVEYAKMWLSKDIFDVWNRRYESLNKKSI